MAKVLVVEDDRLSQKVLGRVFSNAGHETLTAGSTQHAWQKLQEHVLVDMVVLDNQLEQEWGWQFLRVLRSNPAYKGLPVIVYTAHTERSSIVRYVELGVQSLHVKPYQSDVILAELKKALESKWTTQVMEPPEVICSRLGLSSADYGSVLAIASRSIEDSLTAVRKNVMSPTDPRLIMALAGISQQCKSVGIPVIEGVVSSIKKSIEEQDINSVFDGLRSVESLLGMIRHRMLEVMKMDGAVARTSLTVEKANGDFGREAVVPAASFEAEYARDIINKPLWQYGPILKTSLLRPLVTPEQLEATTRSVVGAQPFTSILECLTALQATPNTSVAEVVKLMQETPGFVPAYRRILERITGTDQPMESPQAIAKVVGQEGVAKALTLHSVARIASHLPKASLLNLKQLYTHTFAASITAFEIGRLLNLANNYMLSAAGLVHDSGRWMFAIGEPGVYAVALALSEDDALKHTQVEATLFGVDHHEAGKRLMACTSQPDLIQTAVALHHDPARVENPDFVVTATVIHLAHLLSQAAMASSAVEAKAILGRLREPSYVAWDLLKARGVALPFDTPELVDTLAAIANTSNWTAHQIIGGV